VVLRDFLILRRFSQAVWPAVLKHLGEAIAHRGPDDKGVWLDANEGIGLSHSRLAILDLSQVGQQPMVSASGRFVIALNGGIYNRLDLRQELSAKAWRGHSDTETRGNLRVRRNSEVFRSRSYAYPCLM
jgi:asparagine synthase (glutamine-hydrolysing)